MTVIYEVNLAVDREIAAEYRIWLALHVQEMLALPGFTGARILQDLEPGADDDTQTTFSTQYELVDRAALDDYLRLHAGRMRADGVSRFGDRFRATRRVLGELGSY